MSTPPDDAPRDDAQAPQSREQAAETVPDPASPLADGPRAGEDDTPDVLMDSLAGEEATDRLILGHVYDGIREYDNPMPGWWVALFWATIVFTPVYILGVHVFGFINSYEDDFAARGAQLAAVREAYAASGAFSTEPAALHEYAADRSRIAAGAEAYAAVCAACHGDQGQGLIGPNLVDDFWIHGATPEAVWDGINEGYPTAGMPPWKDQLSDEQRAGLLAFLASIQGAQVPGAKEPQGEPASFVVSG